MDEHKWSQLNDLISLIYDCERRASSLASQYWHLRSKEGVSHPNEDAMQSAKDQLKILRKSVADVARRECG